MPVKTVVMERKSYLPIVAAVVNGFVLACQPAVSQTIIAQQDFETSPAAPEASFTVSGGSFFTTSSTAADRPASSTFYNGGGRAFGINNGTATLTSTADIDVSTYTDVVLSMKIASFSLGSFLNGADAADYVLVEISVNGGSSWSEELRINGNSNAFWNYSNTDATASYDGDNTPTIFAPAGGGSRTTDGYSSLFVNALPVTAQLRLRITLLNNSANEQWMIDDLSIQGTASPVPVQLLFFSGQNRDEKILLEWATAMELNNDHFLIERSTAGMQFTEVGSVEGNGNSNRIIHYSFSEPAVTFQTTLYYRLKQTDRDGSFSYSDIIAIDPMNRKRMSIDGLLPNPFTERIVFDFSMPRAEKVLITLTDFDGRKYYSQHHQGNSGFNRFELNGLNDLSSGIYLLWLQRDSEVTVVKVMRY
jgi:hypothetical protein